jgi:hypothetical protein
MAVPHRNDVAIRGTVGPHHYDRSPAHPPNRQPPNLTIVEAIVDKSCCVTRKYLFCIDREINSALAQGEKPFGGIEGDLQRH